MKLATRIKDICEAQNISISALERRAGIPEKSITKWDQNIPSFDKVEKIVYALNISWDEFLLTNHNQKACKFDEQEMDILRAAVLALMENTNQAYRLVQSEQAKHAVNGEWKIYKELLDRLCEETEEN